MALTVTLCSIRKEKGTPKCFPYSARLVPKSWCTSNGTFHTEGKGNLELQFFEYSHSKTVTLQPDIVEYDDDSDKPTFDLIIGVDSMQEFGIILNFKEQVITIDDDTLPMRDITNLPCNCLGQELLEKKLAETNKLISAGHCIELFITPIELELTAKGVVYIIKTILAEGEVCYAFGAAKYRAEEEAYTRSRSIISKENGEWRQRKTIGVKD